MLGAGALGRPRGMVWGAGREEGSGWGARVYLKLKKRKKKKKEEKGTTDDEIVVGWHHRLNGHGFEWTLGVGDGQGGLEYCGSWDTVATQLLDTIE